MTGGRYVAPRDGAHVLVEVRPAVRLDVLSCEIQGCRVRLGDAENCVCELVARGPGTRVKAGGRRRLTGLPRVGALAARPYPIRRRQVGDARRTIAPWS